MALRRILLSTAVFAVIGVAGTTASRAQSSRIRPEVVIVLDTSGSMNLAPSTASVGTSDRVCGADCGGDRAGIVDLCGDGLCSGLETSASCASDCSIEFNEDPRPGMARGCVNLSYPETRLASRMFIVKRVLRNILPELRDDINVGLVTFAQDGYFEYFRTDPNRPRKKVTIFMPRLQLELMGVWDGANDAPAGLYAQGGINYTLLSSAALPSTEDSLYRDAADPTSERRFRFANAGLVTSQGGRTWEYVGSYYTFEQIAPGVIGTWRGWDGCGLLSCGAGDGDCEALQCLPGLSCSANAGWRYFHLGLPGLPTTAEDITDIDVCEADGANRQLRASYGGPMLIDNGQYWVYRRFRPGGWSAAQQGITPGNAGRLVVPLGANDDQSSVDLALLQTMIRLNLTSNGGILPVGDTATGPAIEVAGAHLQSRDASDTWNHCRARFILLLSDGASNQGVAPEVAAKTVYDLFPGNPIRTLVVALPGLPATGVAELSRIADIGDDGSDDTPDSRAPFTATDEASLVAAIEEAIAVGIGGGDVRPACYAPCGPNTPCPSGFDCFQDSYCVPEAPPVPDGGVVVDGGPADGGGGLDGGVALDGGAPDGQPAADGATDGGAADDGGGMLDGFTADGSLRDAASSADGRVVIPVDAGGPRADGGRVPAGDDGTVAGDDGGCNCRTIGSPTSGAPVWLLLLLLLLRVRRRVSRATEPVH